MAQTAVEWLESQIKKIRNIIPKSLFEQAKQMEKEQSIAELRHKDGTPMRKYNSPKLQAIEMENKQTAVEWLVGELSKYDIHKPMSMADWSVLKELSEQAKQMEKEHAMSFHLWMKENDTPDNAERFFSLFR